MPTQPALAERAPAKVNLSLHVLGRRADGYHEPVSYTHLTLPTNREV